MIFLQALYNICGKIASKIMKIPMKLYLIGFVATLLFVQYHIYAPYSQNDYIYDRKTPCEAIVSKILPDLPPLYIITPTYRRPEQLPELTRLSHTLMLVPNLVWLVIEDAYGTNSLVEEILKKSGIKYEYLIAPMPVQYKNKTKGPRPRGVSNRNKGLEWVREHAHDGVFYFADDDNTYDLDLFSEIRYTKKVSMFPVGLITKAGVSSPIVRNGKFQGFYDGWIGGRKFAVDMAGFAVSVQFLLNRSEASMPYKPGFEEDGFLKSLAPFEPHEAELLASNCTRYEVLKARMWLRESERELLTRNMKGWMLRTGGENIRGSTDYCHQAKILVQILITSGDFVSLLVLVMLTVKQCTMVSEACFSGQN